MAYQIINKNTAITIQLKGHVDLSETSEIKEVIQHEPKSGYEKLVVDASEVDYIDSSGVALLLFIKKLAQDQGLIFEISKISENVHKVIKLAGLDGILKPKNVGQVPSTSNSTSLDDVKLDNLFDSEIESHSEAVKKDQIEPDLSSVDIKPGSFD